MSAFNWIIFEARCPACGESARIRAQTHVASSFDGDEHGRFHDLEYGIGQGMRWWGRDDSRFGDWLPEKAFRKAGDIAAGETEACYATCSQCQATLCALLRFRENVPESVVLLAKEDEWPAGYPK